MKAVVPANVIQLVKKPTETVEELVKRRVEFLTDYQNAAYAERYRQFVARVREAEMRGEEKKEGGETPWRSTRASDICDI